MTLKCCVGTGGTEIHSRVIWLYRGDVQVQDIILCSVSLEVAKISVSLSLFSVLEEKEELQALPLPWILPVPEHVFMAIVLLASQISCALSLQHHTWCLSYLSIRLSCLGGE